MKNTGMVRRVDSLGRIVIPKEIRKVLKIKENEQVEINILDDGILLNKYSDLTDIDASISNLINIIEKIYDKNILITDLNNIIMTSSSYKEYLNLEISSYLNNLLEERKNINEERCNSLSLSDRKENIKTCYIIKTIIKNGDTVGLLIMLSDKINENDQKLVSLMELFLDKYLE